MASRLSPLARSARLLSCNQCGSLPGLSTFDACAALTHEIRTLQCPRLEASTLFLDIKGCFDNISSTILISLMRCKGIPQDLVSWVRSFLADRKCRLIFQGSPNIFLPVQVGTPQGSRVSPLRFVMSVSVLHMPIPRGIIFSYIDDFPVTVSLLSYRRNCQMFQYLYSVMKSNGARIGVSFSIVKTDLCHWRILRDRDTSSHSTISLHRTLVYPSSCVR